MRVVLLAHGSRDPRHREVMDAIAAAVKEALPRRSTGPIAVSVAYLDHAPPTLGETLARSAATATTTTTTIETVAPGGTVVVVPMLLTDAFHARVDVPAAVEAARRADPDTHMVLTPGIGGPQLAGALARRAAEAGVDLREPGTGVVVMAAGSSDPSARAQVADLTASWLTGSPHGTHAFIAGQGPTVFEAVARVAATGARRVVVVPYLLAPGVLPDRGSTNARNAASAAGIDVVVAEPIGAAPELISVVVERITAVPS